jgi:hypothetical protein
MKSLNFLWKQVCCRTRAVGEWRASALAMADQAPCRRHQPKDCDLEPVAAEIRPRVSRDGHCDPCGKMEESRALFRTVHKGMRSLGYP